LPPCSAHPAPIRMNKIPRIMRTHRINLRYFQAAPPGQIDDLLCCVTQLYGRTLLRSLGKRQASFTLLNPSTFWVSRSSPMANPPCGGQPYLKIDR
jgi:hypothetical protein